MMNQGDINSSHGTLPDTNSSPKTVVAILKQVKEQHASKETTRMQQQPQIQTKRVIQGTDQTLRSPAILSQLNRSKGSPLSHVTSSSVISSGIPSSFSRSMSPMVKEHNHTVAMKNNPLNHDLTSCIATQLMKGTAMSNTKTVPNLLRSALQGNMPDHMLNSKSEDKMVAAVTFAPGSIPSCNQLNKQSPVSHNSSNSVSNPHHLGSTFKKIQSTITGSGGYLCQGETHSRDSKSFTVQNLLASTDGTIQTINVSHIPKSVNDGSNIRTLSGNVSSLQFSTARSSQNSAKEIAQQIRKEANGQKSSAQLAGTQQQLRSQIKSSRSIDAHLAPQLSPATFPKRHSLFQGTSSKESEQQIQETAVPLLASKLTPSSVTKLAAPSVPSQIRQQQQLTGGSSVIPPQISVTSVLSSSPLMCTSSSLSVRKSSSQHVPITTSSSKEPPMQHQLRNQQHPKDKNDANTTEHVIESVVANNSFMFHSKSGQKTQNEYQSAGRTHHGLSSGLDQQNVLERFIQQTNASSSLASKNIIQTGIPEESNASIFAKDFDQYISQGNIESSCQNRLGRIEQSLTGHATLARAEICGHGSARLPYTSQMATKNRPSEPDQTAAGVDLDFGQLASIASDGESIQTKSPTNISASASHWTTKIPEDFQRLVPVQAVKTLQSFTVPSLQATSSSYFITPPAMHASSSSSSVSAVLTTAPPPSDYTSQHPNLVRQSQLPEQQYQTLVEKSGQAEKHLLENPFTFPITTRFKGNTDLDTNDPIFSFTFPNDNINNCSNNIKEKLESNFDETKEAVKPLNKYQMNASSNSFGLGSSHHYLHSDVAGVFPERCLKPEASKDSDSHLPEGSEQTTKSIVQPFNQRVSNLSYFPVKNSTYRAAYRSHVVAVQKAKSGVVTDASKSLDILRQNLQHSINKELSGVIKRYTDKYIQPAVENIKLNNSELFVSEEHISSVCRQILEQAKVLYMSGSGRQSATLSDIPDDVSESGSLGSRRAVTKRRRMSDSDSEKGSDTGSKKKSGAKKGRPVSQGGGRVTPVKTFKSGEPVKRDGPKWDSERLKPDTLFVMGARANKALGLGNMRGRLYIRHPDVFKYIGDQEDKMWLSEHNLMSAAGGKAYMLLLEDIQDLSRSDEYKNSPGLMMQECVGFMVPGWMLVKIKNQMNLLSSDSRRSLSPSMDVGELSGPKILPFLSFAECSVKEEVTASPENPDLLSGTDNDSTQPSSFMISGGFGDGVSQLQSDLDSLDHPQPDTRFIS